MWGYDITAAIEGAKNPHITSMSGAIDILAEDELYLFSGMRPVTKCADINFIINCGSTYKSIPKPQVRKEHVPSWSCIMR